MPIFLTTAFSWALKNPKLVAIIGAVVIVGSFVMLSLHWKSQADKASDVIASQREVIKSVDRHAAVQSQIQSDVEKQSAPLRKLPDANVEITPERRAALRHGIECVRDPKRSSCRVPEKLSAR